jgi:hypothetical protein
MGSPRADLPANPRPLLHVLSGARPLTLLRIMAEHGGCSPRYLGYFALTAILSALRAPLFAIEASRVGRRVADARFDPAPIIIVGHWRSGTTYLHNLMSRDPRFCFPTMLDVARPLDFYPGSLEFLTRKLILWNLPARRPMDDVPLNPDWPQEEEMALAAMGSPSLFNCFYFPRRFAETFRREVMFEGLDEGDLRKWRRDFAYFVAKIVALRPGRRLLLKNPANSVRLTELNALFPSARFIHIHRDPREVFVSSRRLYGRVTEILTFQDYDPARFDEFIFDSYPVFMDRLLEGLDTIDPRRRVEVRYADLVRAPVETLKRLYRELEIGDIATTMPAIETFLAESDVSPRSPREFDAGLAARIEERWRRQMVRLGYAAEATPQPAR